MDYGRWIADYLIVARIPNPQSRIPNPEMLSPVRVEGAVTVHAPIGVCAEEVALRLRQICRQAFGAVLAAEGLADLA